MRLRSIIMLHLSGLIVAGCAGPTTPLGAIRTVRFQTHPQEPSPLPTSPASKLQLQPSRQVLHAKRDLQLMIWETLTQVNAKNFKAHYNGHDVTGSFLSMATVKSMDGKTQIEIPSFKLSAETEHQIEFTIHDEKGESHSSRWEPPICRVFDSTVVVRTEDFNPSPVLLNKIERISIGQGFNPSLVTGLIAQESGFNPNGVSWAKAVGLTQITETAETEILRMFPNFPRYPGLNDLGYFEIRSRIQGGAIHSQNEWRLDPERSIRGGVEYLKILSDQWSSESNVERIRRIFADDPDFAHSQLILASYNSGYFRVSRALSKQGRDWLRADELQEARRYVNRIASFCYHFSSV